MRRLYFGDLHFAPAGPLVTSFLEYMDSHHRTFGSIKYHVHQSEKAAVKYILSTLDTPALALIVLRQVTPEKVNYVIRQNYTTLPNTNIAVDRTTAGLNTEYQSKHSPVTQSDSIYSSRGLSFPFLRFRIHPQWIHDAAKNGG
jgi:hypothetical protein